MDGFGVFLRKELREAWRTSRLPISAGVFFIFGVISPLTAKYTPQLLKSLGGGVQVIVPTPQVADAIDQYLKNVGGNGIFIAILLTMGLVAREAERGTAAFVLTKPLSRPAFLGAKLVALLLTLGVGVAVAGVITYTYTALLFKPVSVAGFVGASLLILLMLMAYAALTFLGSTLVRSQLGAAGIGLGGLILVAVLGALPHVGDYTPSGLNQPARDLALGLPPQHLGAALAGTCALIGVALLLTWLAFRSQELATAT